MSTNMIATDAGGPLAGPGGGSPAAAWDGWESRGWRWVLVAVILALVWAYAPNFLSLFTTWDEDPNYSHGYLVIPIALFILWRRLSDTTWEPSRDAILAPWWGWIFLAGILAVRAVAYEGGWHWAETATIVPAITCLTWTLGGWPLLRRTWPAIVFLVFMLPLPQLVNEMLALPLQRIAATGSCFLLQLSRFWVIQQGNVLNLKTPHGMRQLDVALACNGLRMLMCMAATITATIILMPLPRWKRITLLVSAVPIALVSNIIRIVATGWCYYYIEGETGQHWAHDISGWMMMPLALVLVGLELQVLSWLVPERTEAEEEERKTFIPLITGKGGKPQGFGG